ALRDRICGSPPGGIDEIARCCVVTLLSELDASLPRAAGEHRVESLSIDMPAVAVERKQKLVFVRLLTSPHGAAAEGLQELLDVKGMPAAQARQKLARGRGRRFGGPPAVRLGGVEDSDSRLGRELLERKCG